MTPEERASWDNVAATGKHEKDLMLQGMEVARIELETPGIE
jgi:hypothetical protein